MRAPPLAADSLRAFYDALANAYGPQYWWPAATRFEILVGAVLTQHTAWTSVDKALARLRVENALTAEAILAHPDLAAAIRAAGPHHVKARRLRGLCAWFIDSGGFGALERRGTHTLRAELLALPGIGPETADVILLYAFGRPRFIADAYAFRIMGRYGWTDAPARYDMLREHVEAVGPDDAAFYNELHALIVTHAKQRCHKRIPDCAACVLNDRCERRL